jgi:hypothetical protein
MKSRNVVEMRAMIIQLCDEAEGDMCRRIITDMRVRIQEAFRQNGSHIEQVMS